MMDARRPSRALLVLGMHRSGSSAVTRVLSLLGFGLARTLIGSNTANRRGHWESRPLVQLNEAHLQKAGLVWSDWRRGALGRMPAAERRDFAEDLGAVMGEEFVPGQPAVLKDPRMCRLVPGYRAALEDHMPVEAVIVLRNPLEVIASLHRRNGMSRSDAALLWLRHMLDAVSGSAGLPRAFLAYDQLLDDPAATLTRAEAALGAAFPRDVAGAMPDIEAFLSPQLRSHAHTAEDVLLDDLTRGWISDLHDALRRLTRDPDDADALDEVARIDREFTGAEPMLSHVARTAAAELAELRRSRVALEASVELKAAQLEALRQRMEDAEANVAVEMNVLRDRLAEQEALLEAAPSEEEKAEVERLGRKAEKLDARVKRLSTEVLQQKAVHAELQARAKDLKDAGDKAGQRAREAREELEHTRGAVAAAAQDIDSLKTRLAEVEAERDMYRRANREILGSSSWRLTWPVRATLNGLRGLTGRGRVAPELAVAPQVAAKPEPAVAVAEPEPAEIPAARTETPAPIELDDKDVKRIERSPWFDAAFYTEACPEAAEYPGGPAAHYLAIGWRKGLDPSAAFLARAYEHSHADLLRKDDCPLLHFHDSYPQGTVPDRLPVTGVSGEAPRIAVFTAISGGYDSLKEPEGPTEGTDFFLFTDGPAPKPGSVWRTRPFEYVDADPVRTARFVKTHPHLYFGDYDFAIWTDANLALRCDPQELLPCADDTGPIHTWPHPLRDCVYEEGRICIALGKDDEDTIEAAIARLEREKFPRNLGMFETSVVVTRMNDSQVADFYRRWWSRIEQGSRRDQLSLPVVAHESGVEIGHIAHKRICMRSDPRIDFHSHLTAGK